MSGQVAGSSSKPGAWKWGIIVVLVVLGGLSTYWMLGYSRRTVALNLPLWSVSFSPDGKSVVAGSGDVGTGGGEVGPSGPVPTGELIFWDIGSERERVMLEQSTIRSVVWSPNGKFIAAGDFAGVTKLFDPKTEKPLLACSPPAHHVNAVAVSGDGNLVAAGTFDGTIDLWDKSGKEQQVFVVPGEKFLGVAISPTGGSLAATGMSGKAYLYNLVDKGDPLKLQAFPESPKVHASAECTAFSSDGSVFATGSRRALRIWETQTGTMQREIHCAEEVNNIAFAPQGDVVATLLNDGALTLWNFRTGEQLNSTKAHPSYAYGLAFSPNGGRIATVSLKDFIIKIWNAETLQLEASHHRFKSN